MAQEAYAQLLGLGNPRAMSFLSAHLFQTAANLATNRLKQRRNRQRLDEMVIREASDARSPEQFCVAQRDLDLITRAIEELPPKCARAFILVRFDDFDFNQVAEMMDLRPRQVRRLVARALEHCQSVLARQGMKQGGEE